MTYNWQQNDWPNFVYDGECIVSLDYEFMEQMGKVTGVYSSISESDQQSSLLDVITQEAITTSEIEGQILSRGDLISSIKKNLGFDTPKHFFKDKRAEGIGKVMVMSRNTFNDKLTEQMLFEWHTQIMQGSSGYNIGCWRFYPEPMQIVSGSFDKEEVHFEAPPSEIVKSEMTRFIDWYNETLFSIKSPLIKSAITHLYFESIHPFEDGNGRIGRILAEKAISQTIGKPVLLSISATINENKPAYYQSLKNAQRSNNIDQWIKYFSSVIIKSQHDVLDRMYFGIKKSKFFAIHNHHLNPRQIKVLAKMLEKNTTFEGGMNVQKYISITKTSKATATRDLQDLVAKEIFSTSGQAKNTSYNVKI